MKQAVEKVGCELDREIARVVFDCTHFMDRYTSDYLHVKFRGQDSKRFAPSTFIEDAWLVVEEMEEHGYLWTAGKTWDGVGEKFYVVKFGSCEEAKAATMPRAICLAALNAAGKFVAGIQVRPGRAMDALVAVKGLGWAQHVVDDTSKEILGWTDPTGDPKVVYVLELKGNLGKGNTEVLLPHWSTEVIDAYRLAMVDGQFMLKSFLESEGGEYRFKCDFYEAQYSAEAETAPMAICLAFLKTRGILPGLKFQ
jgi:hypothetical protein